MKVSCRSMRCSGGTRVPVPPRTVGRVNKYGRMAWQHWARWRPGQLLAILDPAGFFAQLGEEVEEQVTSMAAEIAGDSPTGESYLDRTGRLGHARFTAEATVLREMVLLPPEPGHPEAEQDPAGRPTSPWDLEELRTGDTQQPEDPDDPGPWPRPAPWLPILMRPGDPYFD